MADKDIAIVGHGGAKEGQFTVLPGVEIVFYGIHGEGLAGVKVNRLLENRELHYIGFGNPISEDETLCKAGDLAQNYRLVTLGEGGQDFSTGWTAFRKGKERETTDGAAYFQNGKYMDSVIPGVSAAASASIKRSRLLHPNSRDPNLDLKTIANWFSEKSGRGSKRTYRLHWLACRPDYAQSTFDAIDDLLAEMNFDFD